MLILLPASGVEPGGHCRIGQCKAYKLPGMAQQDQVYIVVGQCLEVKTASEAYASNTISWCTSVFLIAHISTSIPQGF